MARRISYLVVEGPHDVEFVGRFLKLGGIKRVRLFEELDPQMERLVPRDFPHGGDLLARVPVPVFFQSDSHVVAVHSAAGIDKLATVASDNLSVLESGVHSFGFVLDQDEDGDVATRHEALVASFRAKTPQIELPARPGEVAPEQPRTGIYVVPDNARTGTVEDILVDAGATAYPQILEQARTFVNSVDVSSLRPKDRKPFEAPSGKKKAAVAAVGSILRPGKAVQVTIQDNLWISGKTIHLELVSEFARFLGDLLDEPALNRPPFTQAALQ